MLKQNKKLAGNHF